MTVFVRLGSKSKQNAFITSCFLNYFMCCLWKFDIVIYWYEIVIMADHIHIL